MQKINIFQKFILCFCLTTLIYGCTENSEGVENSDNLSDLNAKFRSIGDQLSFENSNVTVLERKNIVTKSMSNFLKSTKSENSEISYFEFDTKSENGILKINSLNIGSSYAFSKGNSNFITNIVSVENDKGLSSIFEITLKVLNENEIIIVKAQEIKQKVVNINKTASGNNCYGSYSPSCIDDNGDGEVSYGECFEACIGYTLDTSEMTGQVIVGLGLAGGVGCVGCGIAAAAIVGFAAVGCAGGCA